MDRQSKPKEGAPFDWEGDEGLDPDIDSTPYAMLDPKRGTAAPSEQKLGKRIAPFLDRIHSDIKYCRLCQLFGWCFGHSYWVSKLDTFILFSVVIAIPVLALLLYKWYMPSPSVQILYLYDPVFWICVYLEIGLSLWTIGTVMHHMLVKFAHRYMTMPVEGHNTRQDTMSGMRRLFSSSKFQHMVACSHVLFFTIFVLGMLIGSLVIWGVPKDVFDSTLPSNQPFADYFAFYFHKLLIVILTGSIFVSIGKIFVARLVSDFYETAYSTRLADFSYTIRCIKRLYEHAVMCNAETMKSSTPLWTWHERYCLCQQDRAPPKPLSNPSVYHQIQYLLSSSGSQQSEEAHEPNGRPMNQLIETRAGAKKIARVIFEHFYLPTAAEQSGIDAKRTEISAKSAKLQPGHGGVKSHMKKKSRIEFESIGPEVVTIKGDAQLVPSSFDGGLAPKDLEKIFDILDANHNGSISPFELKAAMVSLQKTRVQLTKSLVDHGKAVGKLDTICIVGAMFLTSVLIPIILGFPLKGITSIVTLFLSFKFLFENTFSTMLQSVIFLFVTHPFDVGDRVFINNEVMFVHEMGLFCTTFLRFDSFLIYYPNVSLIHEHIVNVRRSGPMTEWIDLAVDINTPKEKLDALNVKLSKFIVNQRRDFETEQDYLLERSNLQRMQSKTQGTLTRSPSKGGEGQPNVIEVKGWEILDNRLLRLGIVLRHKVNFQEGFPRAARHYSFMSFLHDALKELDIKYYPPTRRVEFSGGNYFPPDEKNVFAA